ncbi:MAG: hypothetical protein IK118_05345 [Clostridia bacterium]|nr:hypothetical protein [Clostridia bacterium]
MKKLKNRQKRMYTFPWTLLLVMSFVFSAARNAGGFYGIAGLFCSIFLYFSCFYGLMLLANATRAQVLARKPKPEKKPRATGRKRRFFKKPAVGSTPPQAVSDSAEAAATGTPDATQTASETETAATQQKKTRAGDLKFIAVIYIALQIYVILRFAIFLLFDAGFSALSVSDSVGFFQIGITVAAAVLFFSVGMWMRSKESKPGSETGRILILAAGVISAVTALLLTLYAVLNIPTLTALLWFLRLFPGAVMLLMLVGMTAAVIKRQVLTDFDYLAIVSRRRNGEKISLADFLEEHTGLSVKSLWSIRYAAGILPAALLALLGVLFVSTCFYKVEPYQQAVVYRLGRIRGDTVVSEGFHVKLPWPVEKTELYNVSTVREISVGYEDSTSVDNLWTQSHAAKEYKLLLGDGNELVSVNMKISFVIDDLYRYVTAYSSPEDVLSAKAYELVMHRTINTDLGTVLSVDRSSLADGMRDELNEFCQAAGLGLRVNQVLLEGIHPPIDVADVYQGVVSAEIQKNTLITNAEASAAEKLAAAEQEANTAVVGARASQTSRVSEVRAEMDVFLAAARAYTAHPSAVTLSKYLDTFETVVTGRRVYVFIGSADPSDVMFNLGGANVVQQSAALQYPTK